MRENIMYMITYPDGTTNDGHGQGKKRMAEYGQRHNIWLNYPEQSNTKRCHPAQYPENLVKDHIMTWSNEGDTVLDCFMGSGTTGKMALLNNRKFIGIEKDETYFKIAQDRIAAI